MCEKKLITGMICMALLILSCNVFCYSQDIPEKWDYFNLADGQYFRYQISSERGLKGWVELKANTAEKDSLDIEITGKWNSEFSETIRLEPGMSAIDFVFSAENFEIANILSNLINIDSFITENAIFREGFSFSEGDKSLEINGIKECGGIKGMVLKYNYVHSMTRKQENATYSINIKIPLPVYAEFMAANDTWIYELAEYKSRK